MENLKNRFDNYEVQPEPQVWSAIEHTLARRAAVRRRRYIAVSAASVAAIAALVWWIVPNGAADTEPTVASAAPVAVEAAEPAELSDQTPSQEVAPEAYECTFGHVDNAPTHEAAAEVSRPAPALSGTAAPLAVITAETPSPAVSTPAPKSLPAVAAPARSAVAQDTKEAVTQEVAAAPTTVATPAKSNAVTSPAPVSPADELVVWIPNAFAPNSGDDDRLRTFKVTPGAGAQITSFKMYIYSRTGRQVFYTNDVNAGWDGTAHGEALPMGTYVYIMEINDAVKGVQHTRGTVTLIR